MHNKSFTADGAATVLGGRNVGDIYFAYGPGEHYIDTDVLALGPAAAEVSTMFDAYWNSASAYPAAMILPDAPDGLTRWPAARSSASVARPMVPVAPSSRISRCAMGCP
jgi:putative cardiolipin synthase